MRIGGVQYLGKSGVAVARFQALARHPSNANLRYLQGAHAQAMTNVTAEAGFSRSLASLQQELQALQTQVNANKPLPPASLSPESTRSVWNPGSTPSFTTFAPPICHAPSAGGNDSTVKQYFKTRHSTSPPLVRPVAGLISLPPVTHPLRVEMAALPDSIARPAGVRRPCVRDLPQVLHFSRLRSPIILRVVRHFLL